MKPALLLTAALLAAGLTACGGAPNGRPLPRPKHQPGPCLPPPLPSHRSGPAGLSRGRGR